MPTSSPGIEAATGRSPLVREALEVARKAHAGQIRNASGGRPYIDHPVAVAERLSEYLDGDELLAAALLHDVVEDSDLEVDDIRARCGDRVAELVAVLRDAHRAEGEEAIAGELKVPLDEKVAVWESDLEMLRRNAGGGEAVRALANGLEEQLSRLRADRASSRSAPC